MFRILCLSLATSLCVGLAQAAEPAPEGKSGIKVGEKAPNFTLKNQSGQEVSLKDMVKEGPIALVFHRSAQW